MHNLRRQRKTAEIGPKNIDFHELSCLRAQQLNAANLIAREMFSISNALPSWEGPGHRVIPTALVCDLCKAHSQAKWSSCAQERLCANRRCSPNFKSCSVGSGSSLTPLSCAHTVPHGFLAATAENADNPHWAPWPAPSEGSRGEALLGRPAARSQRHGKPWATR